MSVITLHRLKLPAGALRSLQRFARLVITLSVLTCVGCIIIPMRVPEKTKDISGSPQKVDLNFIKVGVTSQQEVEENLSAFDTHATLTDVFWGRWESSKVAVGGMAATPNGPNVGATRIWGPMNILVSFDEKGVVTKWSIMKDKKLNDELALLDAVSRLPFDSKGGTRNRVLLPTCCDKPNPVEDLVLSEDSFECRGIKTPRANIRQITPAGEGTPMPDASHIWVTVHFGTRALAGKKGVKSLSMGVEPSTFLLLERYHRQTKSN